MTKYKVELSNVAPLFKKKLPAYIVDKIVIWAMSVEKIGLLKTRAISGYHDEPLKGNRAGQRSVRLNRSYRLIYIECSKLELIIVEVIEVNKHDY